MTDFSRLSECEVRTHGGPVVRPIVETHAVRLGKQCVDFKSCGGPACQLRTPIPFYPQPPAEGPPWQQSTIAPSSYRSISTATRLSRPVSNQSTIIPIGS